MAVLGLRCCMGFSLVVVSGGYFPVVMLGLIVVAPIVAEKQGSKARELQ